MPKSPGVYVFKNEDGDIIYIGKAKSLRDRVSSYFNPKLVSSPKTQLLVSQITDIDHVKVESEIDALILEANLVRKHKPKYNFALKDDKTYPRIEISIKDRVPLVRIMNHEETPGAIYFGPFPIGTEASKMLRALRRIFPFVSQRHFSGSSFRPCFRSHLGLCPCALVFTSEEDRLKYRREIHRLIGFLSGKRSRVQKEITKQMHQAANQMDFEKAQDLKMRLERIALMVSPKTNPLDYQLNPNLVEDIRKAETADLVKSLGLELLVRIECFDISNTSGKLATGSMVVFISGLASKKDYRRFRIKSKFSPDDPAMIAEVISRRLNNLVTWGRPDLIVLDGGVSQLSAARRAIADKGEKIPTIALAKRKEEIYFDTQNKLILPLGSPGLNLLQRLRDEAHRFSQSYHFLLRTKKMLT